MKNQYVFIILAVIIVGSLAVANFSNNNTSSTSEESSEATTQEITTELATTTSTSTTATNTAPVKFSFKAYGKNDHAQFARKANESVVQATYESEVPGVVSKLYAGRNHTFALTQSGEVYGWGDNTIGQLGFTPLSSALPTPTKVPELANVKEIATTNNHSLALTADGKVYAWGSNFTGQLGDGTNTNNPTPKLVAGVSNIKSVAAGHKFSLALGNNGKVYAWGASCTEAGKKSAIDLLTQFGQSISSLQGGYYDVNSNGTNSYTDYQDCLNEEAIKIQSKTPKELPTSNITQISVGYGHALLLTSAGKVISFGCNLYGQRGFGAYERQNEWLTEIENLPTIKAVAAGVRHSLFLDANGTVHAVGSNFAGQLGDGTVNNRIKAVPVKGLPPIKKIYAGFDYSLAVANDGSVWAWGSNSFGLFGKEHPENITIPVKILSSEPTSIALGGAYFLVK